MRGLIAPEEAKRLMARDRNGRPVANIFMCDTKRDNR
jgi:hypothetical protein